MFKRIYIELSDYCNLKCDFCTNNKNTRMLSLEQYKLILDSIKGHTEEVVLHVLGEPLIHKDIVEIVNLSKEHFKVMITTNGFLLKNFFITDFIKFNKMNISLHSTYFLNDESLKEYLDTVFKFIDFSHNIDDEIVFNLRLWTKSNERIEKYIEEKFNLKLNNNNLRLDKKIILTYDKEFTWPSLNDPFNTDKGKCLGGKSHIAILANGDVSICCLDSNADSSLGNIFNMSLTDILSSNKFKTIIQGYNSNKLVLDICKHCTYHNRKKD